MENNEKLTISCQIYFQSMSAGAGFAEEDDSGGETQIEKIPTLIIETRSNT